MHTTSSKCVTSITTPLENCIEVKSLMALGQTGTNDNSSVFWA